MTSKEGRTMRTRYICYNKATLFSYKIQTYTDVMALKLIGKLVTISQSFVIEKLNLNKLIFMFLIC